VSMLRFAQGIYIQIGRPTFIMARRLTPEGQRPEWFYSGCRICLLVNCDELNDIEYE
jgi:hypothetical protein